MVVMAAVAVARADPPLPNAGSPSETPSLPPITPAVVAPPPADDVDEAVRPPDVDALGTMSIRHASGISGGIDLAFAHALGETVIDAYAATPSARVELLPGLAFDAVLPVGNAMIGAAWLPANKRLVGIELRVAAPTSPTNGNGALVDTTVAAPRVADPELYMPHTTSAEFVADWRWRGDLWWLQVEGGAAEWWQPEPPGTNDYTTVLRATLAGGLHLGPWLDLTASFVTRLLVVSRDSSDNFIHGGLVGVVVHGRRGDVAVRAEIRDEHTILVGLTVRAR
jgi:hypothetical protein